MQLSKHGPLVTAGVLSVGLAITHAARDIAKEQLASQVLLWTPYLGHPWALSTLRLIPAEQPHLMGLPLQKDQLAEPPQEMGLPFQKDYKIM